LVAIDRSRLSWAAFGCLAVAGLAFIMWKARANGFFYDDWSWIEFRHTGVNAMLASYNQHLVIAPVAAYQALLATVGLTHYWPYRLLAALAHLACATAVFAFARRRIGDAALLLAAPIVLLGGGWELVIQPFNAGITASLAFGIAALLMLDRADRRGDRLACGALVLGLLCGEFAALFAAGIAVEVTWRDRGLRRAWIWALPIALYGLWWVTEYMPYLSNPSLSLVPKFVANMASAAAGGLFGRGLQFGRVLLLVVAAFVGWRVWRHRALSPRLVALGVILGAFWLLVGYTRASLGEPWASRYVYSGVVLLALIIAESARGARLTAPVMAIAGVVGVLALAGNISAFAGGTHYVRTGSQTVSAELGALELARGVVPPGFILDPRWAPQVIAAPYFGATRAIGSTSADTPAEVRRAPAAVRAAAYSVLVRAGASALASRFAR
jgi:hypothetical protein